MLFEWQKTGKFEGFQKNSKSALCDLRIHFGIISCEEHTQCKNQLFLLTLK